MSEPRSAAEIMPEVLVNIQAALTTRPDPLAHPRAIKIPLDSEQTECLLEHGEMFVVIARETWPGNPKRMQLLCLPVALEVARAAESVALGTHRAVKSKPASKL
jgi:hypothetical protein